MTLKQDSFKITGANKNIGLILLSTLSISNAGESCKIKFNHLIILRFANTGLSYFCITNDTFLFLFILTFSRNTTKWVAIRCANNERMFYFTHSLKANNQFAHSK